MKVIRFVFLCAFVLTTAHAGEPWLLEGRKNFVLYFAYGSYSLTCKPYGVFGIYDLLESDAGSECKTRLQKALPSIKRRWESKVNRRLHIQQGYMLGSREGQCIVHFSNAKNYSQLVLENGLGMIASSFSSDDLRYGAKLKAAQKTARVNSRGIWNDETLRQCFHMSK